jgi:hypothetical protein
VQYIQNFTDTSYWHYVESRQNPADIASRGITVQELQHSRLWWEGPAFLKKVNVFDGMDTPHTDLNPGDPEIKKASVKATQIKEEPANLTSRLSRFSDWTKAKRAIAGCMRFKEILKIKKNKAEKDKVKGKYEAYSVDEMERAECLILQDLQEEAFAEEISVLRSLEMDKDNRHDCRERNLSLKKVSSLYRLDPYLDEHGLIRVGGRIRRADVGREMAHPVIIPRHSHMTQLLIRHFHERTAHSGAETTLAELRACGYWIIGGRTTIRACLTRCVKCRRLHGSLMTQKMADLPEDRVNPAEPFTYSAVDYFGPFTVRSRRSEVKRWGVIFVCMTTRAVHIETADSLSTSSFLNAYRRFVGRRGRVRQLRSDRGSNFVGAKSELERALQEMDTDKIGRELLKDSCDYINFKMNPPQSSHMAGSWERMIRSVRNVLVALLDAHGGQIDDEELRTFMVEAEQIVNSRPITSISPDSTEEPLTPNQILTLKSRIVHPPPGSFGKEDLYCRKRWRTVQYLADRFWNRWKKEYLTQLSPRQKWTKEKENVQDGDIVLVKDEDLPRNEWPIARVIQAVPSQDGLVRKVQLKMKNSVFDRPIHKLVLLYRDSPSEEP